MMSAENRSINWRFLGLSLSLVAGLFFLNQVVEYFQKIPVLEWDATAFVVIAISIAMVGLSVGIAGLIWHLLLFDCGITVSLWITQTIFLLAQFGKYLPGNVAHHLGRVYMAKQAGIPPSITIQTMLMEILWVLGVTAGLASCSLLYVADSALLNELIGLNMILLGLLFPVALLLPWLGIRTLNRFFPDLAHRFWGGRISEPRLRTALIVTGLFGLLSLIMGGILKMQAQWIFDHSGGSFFQLTCLFALAWIAGYLVPGAPAGLGIREAMILFLMSPIFGDGIAIGLGITLRLTTTLGDGLAFLIGVSGRTMYHKYNDQCMN